MATSSLKKLLEDFFRGTNFKEINTTISAELVWNRVVGKPISNNTKIKSLKRGILNIKTSSPVWRNELFLQKRELLKKLKQTDPNLNIKEIIFK